MKFNSKIISLILIVSFLVSALSIFSFAAEEGASEDITILYNRNYEEGWAYNNGLTTSQIKTHKFSIDYEEDELRNYNYFLRAEAGSTTAGYLYYNFAGGGHTPLSGGTIVELSIKADDVCDIGEIVTGYTRRSDLLQFLIGFSAEDRLEKFTRFAGAANDQAFPQSHQF